MTPSFAWPASSVLIQESVALFMFDDTGTGSLNSPFPME